jgi:hypothetical protein
VARLPSFALSLCEPIFGAQLIRAVPKFYFEVTDARSKRAVFWVALSLTAAVSAVTGLALVLMYVLAVGLSAVSRSPQFRIRAKQPQFMFQFHFSREGLYSLCEYATAVVITIAYLALVSSLGLVGRGVRAVLAFGSMFRAGPRRCGKVLPDCGRSFARGLTLALE